MPNITIHLDEDTHRLAKVYAAQSKTSLSKLFRNHIRQLAGSANDSRKRLIFDSYCSGSISRSEAMNELGLRSIETFYATLIEAGFDLPRQTRKDALETGNAAVKFIEESNRE